MVYAKKEGKANIGVDLPTKEHKVYRATTIHPN
jgi:hypothetical protein